MILGVRRDHDQSAAGTRGVCDFNTAAGVPQQPEATHRGVPAGPRSLQSHPGAAAVVVLARPGEIAMSTMESHPLPSPLGAEIPASRR